MRWKQADIIFVDNYVSAIFVNQIQYRITLYAVATHASDACLCLSSRIPLKVNHISNNISTQQRHKSIDVIILLDSCYNW